MNELDQLQKWHRLCNGDMSQNDKKKLYKGLIDEEYKEFTDSETVGNALKEALDLIVVAGGFIAAHGININQVLGLVNESNMSKFLLPAEVNPLLKEFKAGTVEARPVCFDLYGIYRLSDGKLLKTAKYAPVDEDRLEELQGTGA